MSPPFIEPCSMCNLLNMNSTHSLPTWPHRQKQATTQNVTDRSFYFMSAKIFHFKSVKIFHSVHHQCHIPVVFHVDPILPETGVLLRQDLYLHDHLVVQLYHGLVQLAQVPAHVLPLLRQLLGHAQHISEQDSILK